MRRRMFAIAAAALTVGASAALAQPPQADSVVLQTPPPAAAQPPVTASPPVRPVPPPAPTADTRFNAPSMLQDTAQSTPAPVQFASPRMIGDFPGYFGQGFVTTQYCLNGKGTPIVFDEPFTAQRLPAGNLVVITLPNGQRAVVDASQLNCFATVSETYQFAALAFSRGAFKIAENEAVRPQDRFYVTYDYFSHVPTPLLAAGGLLTLPANSPFGTAGTYVLRDTLGATVNGNGQVPTSTLNNVMASTTNLHRETIGFEKTFFNGTTSVGVRVPVFQTDQASSTAFDPGRVQAFAPFDVSGQSLAAGSTLDRSRVGDMSFILKYAPINDDGRTVSGGLVITAPTGGGILLADGSKLYSTLLQPWVGGFRSWDRVYVHAFASVAVPTDHRDLTIFFNDFGIGYFLYQAPEARWLTAITPTVECHINTPLDRVRDSGISSPESVFFTGGVHFGIGQRATLTFSVATPVTGPRPDQVEAAVQLNWNF